MSSCKREVQLQQDRHMEEPDPGLPENRSQARTTTGQLSTGQSSTPNTLILTEQTREEDQMSSEIPVVVNRPSVQRPRGVNPWSGRQLHGDVHREYWGGIGFHL